METMKYKGEEDKVVMGGPDNVVSLSTGEFKALPRTLYS